MRLGDRDRQLLRIVAVLLIAYLALQVFAQLWQAIAIVADVLLIFVVAWALAFVLGPLVDRVDRATPLDRTMSVVVVYIGVFVFMAIVLSMVVAPVSQQLAEFSTRAPEYGQAAAQAVVNAQVRLQDLGIRVDLAEAYGTLPQRLGAIASAYAADILGVLTATAGALFNVTLVLIIAFLMLIDGRAMWERLLLRLPERWRSDAELLRESTDRAFGGFIRGSLLLGTIYGVATFLILFVLRVPFEGVLAIVSGLTVIIPFFGPIIALIPVIGVTAVAAGDRLLIVFVAMVVLQQIALNVISPRIMSKTIGIHPIFVFLAILLGAKVAGFWGVVLAMPIAGVMNTLLQYVWPEARPEPAHPAPETLAS